MAANSLRQSPTWKPGLIQADTNSFVHWNCSPIQHCGFSKMYGKELVPYKCANVKVGEIKTKDKTKNENRGRDGPSNYGPSDYIGPSDLPTPIFSTHNRLLQRVFADMTYWFDSNVAICHNLIAGQFIADSPNSIGQRFYILESWYQHKRRIDCVTLFDTINDTHS